MTTTNTVTLYAVKEHPTKDSWHPVSKEVNQLFVKMLESKLDSNMSIYYLPAPSSEEQSIRYYKNPLDAYLYVRKYCKLQLDEWNIIHKMVDKLINEVTGNGK